MKILVLADEESKLLYDYFKPGMLDDIDLILACGDLHAAYLSFLVTMSHATVLYIRGNHDHYEGDAMNGCICIEDDIYVYKGIRILGLGGSMRYHPEAQNQYSEREMAKRIRRLKWKLLRHRGFDILMTHAPAYQLNDGMDLPHQGFQVFRTLLEKYKPKFFLHGHVHMSYGRRHKRHDVYQETQVINAFERCEIDYENFSPDSLI